VFYRFVCHRLVAGCLTSSCANMSCIFRSRTSLTIYKQRLNEAGMGQPGHLTAIVKVYR
jgi:hypothetical protein